MIEPHTWWRFWHKARIVRLIEGWDWFGEEYECARPGCNATWTKTCHEAW